MMLPATIIKIYQAQNGLVKSDIKSYSGIVFSLRFFCIGYKLVLIQRQVRKFIKLGLALAAPCPDYNCDEENEQCYCPVDMKFRSVHADHLTAGIVDPMC